MENWKIDRVEKFKEYTLAYIEDGADINATNTTGHSGQDVDIYAKVSGFIKFLNVDVGSEVKKGQLLALAEAPELSAQLSSADSKLKGQEAVSIGSKANYERILEASKFSGAVSKNDVDQALARRNADLAQLEAAKSAYREVSDLKKYLEIRAPFNGIISARNASTGAYIGPSGKGSEFPLFVLTLYTLNPVHKLPPPPNN